MSYLGKVESTLVPLSTHTSEPHLLSHHNQKEQRNGAIEWVQDGVMQRQMHGKLLCGEAAATPAPPCQPKGGQHPPPQRLSLSTFSCKVIFTFIIILSSSGGSSWVRGKAVFTASLSLGCFPLPLYFQVESPEASDVYCMKLRGCGGSEQAGCLVYWLLLWVHLCLLSKEN